MKAVPAHRGTAIVFSGRHGKRLFERLKGHRVIVVCERGPSPNPAADFDEDSVGFRAPRNGLKLHVGFTARRWDWCEVLVDHTRMPNTPVVAVALTPSGRVFLDERVRASVLTSILDVAQFDSGAGHFPSTAEVVAKLHSLAIGLATPNDPVAAGKYGFYSDGAKHEEAVATTPAGRRLFIDVNGDTLSSNVFPQLTSSQAMLFDPFS